MKIRGQMGTNDEKERAGKGSRRKGQIRWKVGTTLEVTDSKRVMMRSWEVRVRQMKTERRLSCGRAMMTSFGKEPTHTKDIFVQKLKPYMTNPS